MYKKVVILMLTTILFSLILITTSEGSSTIEEIREIAEFDVLMPPLQKNWRVEVKEPIINNLTEPVTLVQLNYFEKEGALLFTVLQHIANGYIEKNEITIIDVQNHTEETKSIQKEFEYDTSGQVVKINNHKGHFQGWIDGTTGGILRWINNNTYIEIDSKQLSKESMIELAESMK